MVSTAYFTFAFVFCSVQYNPLWGGGFDSSHFLHFLRLIFLSFCILVHSSRFFFLLLLLLLFRWWLDLNLNLNLNGLVWFGCWYELGLLMFFFYFYLYSLLDGGLYVSIFFFFWD
ncbi:hypothetical protein BKA61DRAFT_55877 [Leptodontidium sp. MPI-SDFR-AT-0119]|nr:hypothetical protein BKA61DRAFT_55877 [Leptodontidium sp. MPI-SDFR-AT-0119]